jgi:predicted RecA/RadA family phage recombinase
MKNFVQIGNTVRMTAPYTVVSGAGAKVGRLFGVATGDITSGAVGEFQVRGVVDIAKAAGAWTEGAGVYWDDTNKVATMSRLGIRIGVAVLNDANAMAQSGDATGRARLDSVGDLRVAFGEVTLDGANPTSALVAATGLSTIIAATASLKSAVAPGDDPSWLSVDYGGGVAAGQLDIYAWKNTGGTDPTLVASTNAAAVISWIAIGT